MGNMAAAASVPAIARAGSSKDVKMAVASMPTDDVVKRGWLEKRVVSRESSGAIVILTITRVECPPSFSCAANLY